ncbi:DUF4855 domain-containing protein [Parabacteroides sp. Marseille-P3160]|uniref:DUF4855 domain-containing protein n=1 Tax=Parabacteroides sp. Marseille-P3160 TaxID=1917887 RepID=UPI00190EFED2|nr:DUF4855 domain-containing protein [Parabacteroides sp. Marseille-P3160]
MTFKRIQAFAFALAMLFIFASCVSQDKLDRSNNKDNHKKKISQIGNHPKDMVLIYDGGVHRNIHWTAEHFAPYVSYREQNGKDKWLFDGFLFLEFKDGKGRCFASYYEKQGARQVEWKALLDNYFREGNAVMALNDQIKKVVEGTKMEVTEKKKVVLCLPEPIPNQKDWGEIHHMSMDFSLKEDRFKACKWYIDYAEALYRKASPQYLDLVGFYWIAEEATNSRDLAGEVSDYIHQKGYNFYWIPYFKSDGYKKWQELGFDKAYYQPNYFFKEDIPISQIEEACQTAIDNGMNLEIEFDERALAKQGWAYRLNDYINVFNKYGALDTMNIAYYQGGDAFYKLYYSENPSDKELYRRLADIVAKRQINNK